MGDRITYYEDCPKCGGKETVECYEQDSANLRVDSCSECDWHVNYDFDEDAEGVISITARPSEQLPAKPKASPLTPDTNIREIEDNIKVLLKQRISPPAQDLELLAYELAQLLTKARIDEVNRLYYQLDKTVEALNVFNFGIFVTAVRLRLGELETRLTELSKEPKERK